MITREHIKGQIQAFIGNDGIAMLSPEEWRDFTAYTDDVVRLDNQGRELITKNGSNLNLKDLTELHRDFNAATIRFTRRLVLGKDGERNITLADLLGDMRSAHPGYSDALCARLLLLWAIEHKINMKYREKYEGKKPKYDFQIISDDPLSPFPSD